MAETSDSAGVVLPSPEGIDRINRPRNVRPMGARFCYSTRSRSATFVDALAAGSFIRAGRSTIWVLALIVITLMVTYLIHDARSTLGMYDSRS